MKYTELIPNVKWNCPSSNNRNVLIICHPKQIPYYLSQVKDFIWERFTNITIWQTKSEIGDRNQFLKEVDQMDAVICIITDSLVSTSNKLGDDLLAAVIEKKYPFLPIVYGENMKQIVGQKYGHIHFAKCKEKKKIRFDVIEKFIKELSSSDKKRNQWFEYSHKDIKYFSQSYFISYRKVDGKYIDYLQHRIHEETSLVDTQLWYDSYLTPGEDFDENLKKNIKKSSAVILVITPHLLEPNNYVLRIEIPFAKQCGKPVIGILMEETDLMAIRDLYGVKKIYKLEEWASFTDILSDAGIPSPDVNFYPRHLYKLATAYIDGNDVECNMKIACELLYQAIHYKYLAAYEKLIEIKTGKYEECQQQYKEFIMKISLMEDFRNKIEDNSDLDADCDEWIKRLLKIKADNERKIHNDSYKDIVEATRLFDEYIKILEEINEINPTGTYFIPLLDCLRKYGEFYLNEHMLKEAVDQLLVFYKCVEPLEKQKPNKLFTYLSVASLLLAKTYCALEDYDMAEQYYKKSVDIDRMLNDGDTFNSVTYTNLLTSLCEFGDFCQKRGKLLKAKIMYQEVLQTIQNNHAAYERDWDRHIVYIGYNDETSAKKTEELNHFARISLLEIENEFLKAGKFRPTIKTYPRKLITDSKILKSCDGDEVQLLSHEIMINSIDKICWLIDFASKSEFEFDICQNKFCMDAKCPMAVMTLDINEVCQLVVHTADMAQATEVLREIVETLNE